MTAFVVTVKDPDDFPAATVTLPGTVTPATDELSFTTTEPLIVDGTALRKTSPLALTPPETVDGVMLTSVTWNGLTVRVAVCVTAP